MTDAILSRALGGAVEVGDLVWVDVDLISLWDRSAFPFIDQERLALRDPRRVVFSRDHHVSDEGAFTRVREWARGHGVPEENLFDLGRHGISHQVPLERGRIRPGDVVAVGDTQGSTSGAFNCLPLTCVGVGIEYAMVTGSVWLRVPEVMQVTLEGEVPPGVAARDIAITLLRELGSLAAGRIVEIDGPALARLSIDARLSIANVGAQLGAVSVVMAADARLQDHLRALGVSADGVVHASEGAQYAVRARMDLTGVRPQLTGPGALERPAATGDVAVTAAFIGSCASGRLEDLRAAARELDGRRVAPGVRLVVTPISADVARRAEAEGLLRVLSQAGAVVTSPGCGACFGGPASPLLLRDEDVCISTGTDISVGRMGSGAARIHAASAAVVAEAAWRGRLPDVRNGSDAMTVTVLPTPEPAR